MSSKRLTAEKSLLERLREGDETAFSELIDRLYPSMLRLTRMFVDDEATAEEVVQETWLAVIDGLDKFEERSSLKTWIFSILTNKARKRASNDARTRAWSTLFEDSMNGELSSVSERFDGSGRWKSSPVSWKINPEEQVMKQRLLEVIQKAIEELPASQRSVVWLRDVEGLSSEEVCEVLDISPGNQRVLLHRGRTKVRAAVEAYQEAL